VFGAIATFIGARFFKITIAVVGGGITFLFLMLIFSVWGLLDGLKEDDKYGMAVAVITFIIALSVAGFVGSILYSL